jgi:hypothetical protein
MTGSALSSFSGTIGRFLQRSKRAGLKKVVIDLQQNYDGEVLLAVDTFKQFFPAEEPFGGSRLLRPTTQMYLATRSPNIKAKIH